MMIFKRIKNLEKIVVELGEKIEERVENAQKIFIQDFRNLHEHQSSLRGYLHDTNKKISDIETEMEILVANEKETQRMISRLISSLEGNVKRSYELRTKIGHCMEEKEIRIQQLKEATQPHSIETLMRLHQENENKLSKLREELNKVGKEQ